MGEVDITKVARRYISSKNQWDFGVSPSESLILFYLLMLICFIIDLPRFRTLEYLKACKPKTSFLRPLANPYILTQLCIALFLARFVLYPILKLIIFGGNNYEDL